MLKLLFVFASACILACGSSATAPSKTTAPAPTAPAADPAFVPIPPDTPVRIRIGNLGCVLVLPSAKWTVSEERMADGSPYLKIDLTDTSFSLIVYAIANPDGVPIEQRLEGERNVFLADPSINISPVADVGNGRWAFTMESQAEHGGLVRGKVYAVPIPGRNDAFFLMAAMGLAPDYEATEDAVTGILDSIELAQ
ncbi:MAG: hypothetical protein QY323_02280 [Patescibacteria group bacterium]|nr:MAG: hypothetical protein QY323_02280 [Patescibacteria group bacterium]